MPAVRCISFFVADYGMFGNNPPTTSCSVDPELNMKVSMWEGSITQLETDAIVNAADSTLKGSGGGKTPNIM
jgi:hypothetical protein